MKYILWFDQISKDDVGLVGGKAANLGEMTSFEIPVPAGFVVTARAYFKFLEEANLKEKLKKILESLDTGDTQNLQEVSEKICREILAAKIPPEIKEEILAAYSKLDSGRSFVAVRSSATAEDLPGASFAGQQETFLNICGREEVLEAVQKCWASLFTPRAIFYRQEKKFSHLKVGLAAVVQKMVDSQTSGVCFTLDPVSNDKKKIIIEAIYGLGELIVQGAVTPDHYEIDKSTLRILVKNVKRQKEQLVKVGTKTKKINISPKFQVRQKITDEQILEIARLAKKIERHYFFPQDIEWAKDMGRVYIVQTRPVTTLKISNLKSQISKSNNGISNLSKLPLLLMGVGASPGIATGPVKIILTPKEINKVKKGEILVAPKTNPDYVPSMKKAVAIVTDSGGKTSHAAIVSRELGIPCVVGTEKATKILKTGMVVKVDGKSGKIYKASLLARDGRNLEMVPPSLNVRAPIDKIADSSSRSPQNFTKTATKLYVNLAEPEKAYGVAQMNVDGVGLLRAEFMISEIGTHPKKLIADGRQKEFIEKLTGGLKTFCEAFYPRPVVYRATDFKTNEYRNLKGGERFEPREENPFLGFRGAFRYTSNPEVFKLELLAIKHVRNKLGFRNLWLMLPFVRTPQELLEVKKIISSLDLVRSPSFKLWLMVEIPANVILLEKFIEAGIDGVSLGTNDLTMLILGVDRDNEEVAQIYDEQNEAVLWAVEKVVKTCQKYKITSSICGQSASSYPDLVEKLVGWGITSVSVSPDAIERTREVITEAEKKLMK